MAKKLRIVLTNPPWYGDTWHGIRAGCRWPFIMNSPKPPENTMGFYNTYPFFLAYTASYLTHSVNAGDIFFYDALACAHTYEKFYETIKSVEPDIVLMEISTPSINNDLEIAKKLKDMGIEVAIAGPHATTFATKLIQSPVIDYVLKGEYEVSAFEMCLIRKKGIYESRPKVNIDTLPFPHRDQSVLLYADGFGQDAHIRYPQLQVWTSRGCPHQCTYCLWTHTMTNRNYRKRSPKMVSKEITGCMRDFGFKSVLLDDDCFNIGDKHTVDMSLMLSKIDIQWHAMVRPDTCDRKSFAIMRDCGCEGLKIGVETFSQNGLDYIKKGYDSNELIETIDYLIGLGFKVFLSMMDDIPTETQSGKEKTKYWLDYFVKKGASFQHPQYTALPGTEAYTKEAKKDNWRDYGVYYTKKAG